MITEFDPDEYLNKLIPECRNAFGDRLKYAGLQGSYMRGEAGENSDIDIMLVLDGLSVRDMDVYRDILMRIGSYERSCGFICGREELARWNPLEICQLRHTTRDLYGTLDGYLPDWTREDEVNYVKVSLGNLYHEICHRYIHADRKRNEEGFRASLKGVFYIVQNMYYLERGVFPVTKRELKELASAEDREVLTLSELADGFDFDKAFAALLDWCRGAFERADRLSGTGSP